MHQNAISFMGRFGLQQHTVYTAQINGQASMKHKAGRYDADFLDVYKRQLPDGPKVGSVTLSPRGDWRMPSDASAALWVAQADALEE